MCTHQNVIALNFCKLPIVSKLLFTKSMLFGDNLGFSDSLGIYFQTFLYLIFYHLGSHYQQSEQLQFILNTLSEQIMVYSLLYVYTIIKICCSRIYNLKLKISSCTIIWWQFLIFKMNLFANTNVFVSIL